MNELLDSYGKKQLSILKKANIIIINNCIASKIQTLHIYMTIAIARPRATTRFLFLRQGSATDGERSHGKTTESTLPLFSIQKFYKEDLEDSHRINTTPGAFDPNSRHFRRRTSELPEKYILG